MKRDEGALLLETNYNPRVLHRVSVSPSWIRKAIDGMEAIQKLTESGAKRVDSVRMIDYEGIWVNGNGKLNSDVTNMWMTGSSFIVVGNDFVRWEMEDSGLNNIISTEKLSSNLIFDLMEEVEAVT